MSPLLILCVEDEPEVRDALARDLEPYQPLFRVEMTEDVPDARDVLAESRNRGERLALILCDHLLPGENGVEFLIELNHAPETEHARKVLVTGQAGLEDTIRAVNEADLDHYIAKPWTLEELHAAVREQLTDYVIEQEENLLPYVSLLDAQRIMDVLRERGADK
jgi:CheY-like chemotaxis protein